VNAKGFELLSWNGPAMEAAAQAYEAIELHRST
jgi:hypothetical protein